jgi:FkbM family methyltransferase
MRQALFERHALAVPPELEWLLPHLAPDAEGRYHPDGPAVAALERVVAPGATVLDVGAHASILAVIAAQLAGGDGCVHTFEANVDLVPLQLALAECNGVQLHVHAMAVGDRDAAAVPFHVKVVGPRSGSSLDAALAGKPFTVTRRVRMVRLDTFCELEGVAPDVVKVDVEGAEVLVLAGAATVLVRDRPALVIDTHDDPADAGDPRYWVYGGAVRRIGGRLDEALAALEAHGYRLEDMTSGTPERVTAAEYVRRHGSGLGTLLATPR